MSGEGSSSRGGKEGSKQKHKFWKSDRGGGRGGRGGQGGSSGRGGGDRGRGGSRGGSSRGGGRGGFQGQGSRDRPPRPAGENGESKLHHLGRYRESSLHEMMTAPGLSVSCIQNKEKSAERELINYLEQVADELYPETIESASTDAGDLDLEELLQKELDGMKENNKSTRFRLCRHDTPCVFYINILPPLDPVRIVHHILSKIETSGRSPFRYIARIIPISAVSGATIHQLGQVVEPVIRERFKTEDDRALKFAIQTTNRRSNKLDRMEMINKAADMVKEVDPRHSVNLGNPDRTIMIEVFKNSLGVAVVEDYEKFKKYNPGALAEFSAKKQGLVEDISNVSIDATKQPAPVAPETDATVSAPSAMEVDDPAKTTPAVEPIPEQQTAPENATKEELSKSEAAKKNTKVANREALAAKYNAAHGLTIPPPKRKADELRPLESRSSPAVNPEEEDYDEIIQDGKVIKVRRTA